MSGPFEKKFGVWRQSAFDLSAIVSGLSVRSQFWIKLKIAIKQWKMLAFAWNLHSVPILRVFIYSSWNFCLIAKILGVSIVLPCSYCLILWKDNSLYLGNISSYGAEICAVDLLYRYLSISFKILILSSQFWEFLLFSIVHIFLYWKKTIGCISGRFYHMDLKLSQWTCGINIYPFHL